MQIFAELNVFEISISLTIIFYIFIAIASLSFIIYCLNLLFRKNKFKVGKSENDEWVKSQELERAKEDLDNEIMSIVKNRKESTK